MTKDMRRYGDNLRSSIANGKPLSIDETNEALDSGRAAALELTAAAREIYGPYASVTYEGFHEWGGFALWIAGGAWKLGNTAQDAADHLGDFVDNPMAKNTPIDATDSTGRRSWFSEVD